MNNGVTVMPVPSVSRNRMAIRAVGIHEVQYAVVVILAMGLGLFSPPFGVGYNGACAVSRIHPDAGIRPIAGYMLVLLIGLIVIAAVPWISTGFLG